MKLKLKITRDTTASELIHLGNFFTALGLNNGAKVFAAPADPAELDEGEVTFVHSTQAHDLRTGEVGTIDTGIKLVEPEAPKKRRRTKAEIEAAQAAAPGTTVETTQPVIDTDPHQTVVEQAAEKATATAEDAAGNVQPASTPPADSTEAATTTPATASPSEPAAGGKEYSEAEVQDLAGKVARTVGPEVVKGKIAELGATRIAELTQTQRNDLGAFLVSKLP